MVIALSYIATPKILQYLIGSPEIYDATLEYVNWRMWGLISASIILMSRSFFVSITQTKVLTLISIVMVCSNIMLNYALVFGKWGAPQLGISGAAIASNLSEVIAIFTYLIYFILKIDLKKYGFTKFIYRNFTLLKSILNVSVWTMLQQFISVSTWFLFFVAIEHLGERELAISNLIKSLFSFIFVVINPFASTVSSVISNLIGEEKINEVMPTTNRILKLCYLVTLPFMALMIIFAYPVLRIYTDNVELITQSIPSLLVMVIGNILLIPGWIYLCAVLGTGNSKYTMIIEFFAMIVYVLYTFIIIEYLKLALPICWGADIVYNLAILIFSYQYMYKYKGCVKKI
jgi:putative MATE family efflux protein